MVSDILRRPKMERVKYKLDGEITNCYANGFLLSYIGNKIFFTLSLSLLIDSMEAE